MSDSHDTSLQCIEDLKSGDRTAFEHIYYRFECRLFNFALKLTGNRDDAEEIVQEVFIKLWESRQFVDSSQNFDGYLFRIARNIVYNRARHKVYELAYFKYLDGNYSHTGNLTEDSMNFQELNRLLEEIYDGLPPVRKQVFIMSRIEGLSNSEIAELLKTSNSNVENHIYKALREIRKKFDRYKIVYLLFMPFVKVVIYILP